jgi:hypothetical protein
MIALHERRGSSTPRPPLGPACATATPQVARRTCIATETRRLGRRLFNQPLWLWGQDIRRPEGNALITYGFERTRPPEGLKAGNVYRVALGEGRELSLWGFGLYLRDAAIGGIFMPRFTFIPQVTTCTARPDDVWSAAQLAGCRPPRDAAQWARARSLLLPVLRWIVEYERWIVRLRGPHYRCACIAPWPHQPIAAKRLIDEWTTTTAAFDEQMTSFIAARRQ